MRLYAYPRKVRITEFVVTLIVSVAGLSLLAGTAIVGSRELPRWAWVPLSEFIRAPYGDSIFVPLKLVLSAVSAVLFLFCVCICAAALYIAWRNVSTTCSVNGRQLTVTRIGKSHTIDLASVTSVKAKRSGSLLLKTSEGVLRVPLMVENARGLIEELKGILDGFGLSFGTAAYRKALEQAAFRAWLSGNYRLINFAIFVTLAAAVASAHFLGAYAGFDPFAHHVFTLIAAGSSLVFLAGPWFCARPRFIGAWKPDWSAPDAAYTRGILFWSAVSALIALAVLTDVACRVAA